MTSYNHHPVTFRQDYRSMKSLTIGKPPSPSTPKSSMPLKSILKHNEAKTVIENTLMKTAGIISQFTENALNQNSAFLNKILEPERFGFTPNLVEIVHQEKSRSFNTLPPVEVPSEDSGRRKLDYIAKLPSAIADILKNDSNSSIPSMQKAKKYHYHSKKMSLKQREDSKDKYEPALTSSNENKAPKIVVVSTPLQIENDSTRYDRTTSKTSNLSEMPTNGTKLPRLALSLMESCYGFGRDSTNCTKASYNMHHVTSSIKSEKKVGVTPHMVSAVVRKPDKVNIGVENGVAFVLGHKTKSPYLNTFGDPNLHTSGGKEFPSNRKWVVNVGNFLDEEISLALIGNSLTITGSRLPSLNFPEIQTVSETIPLPKGFDVNNLRILRADDARSFLVIQDLSKGKSTHSDHDDDER